MFTTTPPEKLQEKILVYGGSTTGKSHSILQLAQTVAIMDSTAKVYALDSDKGLDKLWKSLFPDLKNFHHKLVTKWPDVEDAMKELEKVIQPQDWLCIDMVGKFWNLVQSYEVGEIYGKKASEYMIVARAEAVAASKLNKPVTLPGVDWNVIKKLHNEEFLDRIVTEFPCNVFVTTAADPIMQEWDDQKIVSMTTRVGYKPDGEKNNVYRFDTVMYLTMFRDGTRVFSTVKDRARPLLNQVPFTNLITDYHAALIDAGVEGIFKED